jgi:hypothetical protein
VAGNTITAAGHNDNWSDVATEITNSVAVDGQSTMTGVLKAANGAESTPALTFGSDTNTGVYRIGADNIGVSTGGTKRLDLSTTGLAITGTLSASGTVLSTGNFTVGSSTFVVTAASGNTTVSGTLGVTGVASFTAAIRAANGTVAAPSISFTNETDCGLYFIGTNNIGAAVNGAKVLDIATTGLGVTGLISATTTITAGTGLVATTSVTGATVAGAMVATEANQETGTATDLIVTPGRQKHNPLHPKAWATVQADGTILVGSGISGVVKDSVGDWTVTMTTAMTTSNYGVLAFPNDSSKNAMKCTGRTSSTVFTLTCWNTASNADADPTDFTVMVFGTQ